jgi:hypothetical protein
VTLRWLARAVVYYLLWAVALVAFLCGLAFALAADVAPCIAALAVLVAALEGAWRIA